MININNKEWEYLDEEDVKKAIIDGDESFFFEFKDDRVDAKKIAAEISALANTYGGYIFIGVSDDKRIDGCNNWNEQRIHITIHDSLSPIPSFDIKKFTFENEKNVYVIKVDKGLEPPYITNKGMIYERVSSGSFPIKDSSKLTQMFYQKESELKHIEDKISIPPITENGNNLFGYIDVGFQLFVSSTKEIQDAFQTFDIDKYNKTNWDGEPHGYTLSRVGNSIVCIFKGLSTVEGKRLPANTGFFLEIMSDGSAKYRTLLIDSDDDKNQVNFMINNVFSKLFENIYNAIFGTLVSKIFIGAKKYEKLTTLYQFTPYYNYGKVHVEIMPELREKVKKMQALIDARRKTSGIDIVISSSRIPNHGLYTIDKKWFSEREIDMTSKGIIEELFNSSFNMLGYMPEFTDINKS